MRDKIRVGVLLDAREMPAWQLAALESIAASDCAVIARLITCDAGEPVPARPRGVLARCVHPVVRRLERGRVRPGKDACTPGPIDVLPAPERDAADEAIDVLIMFADPASTGTRLPPARFGQWYFASSGRPFSPANGTLVGLEDLVRRRDSLETSLVVRDPDGGCNRIAYRTRSAIDYASHCVTRNEHLWKCSSIVIRALRSCHAAQDDYVPTLAPADKGRRDIADRLGLLPSLVSFLAWRAWKKAYRKAFAERWILMTAIDERAAGEGPFTTLEPPRDRFWADPHVIEHEGRHHVFFEDASLATGIGHISVMSDDGEGRFGAPRCIIRRPYHLSYPFVFRWNDTWYLLPESGQNRTVELYRALRFPDVWEPAQVLLRDTEAYDCTLVEHRGHWWLFANMRAAAGASTWDELHVFYADSPLSSTWHPHAANPVISDVRRARPAGRFYWEDGKLYRPSQDSSRRYGRALNINEVVALDAEGYQERIVRTIEPDWRRGMTALHSYSRAGRLTLVDAIRRERRKAAPAARTTDASTT